MPFQLVAPNQGSREAPRAANEQTGPRRPQGVTSYVPIAAWKRSRSQLGMGVERNVFMSTVTAMVQARKTGLPATDPS